jgi:hypothetical protein
MIALLLLAQVCLSSFQPGPGTAVRFDGNRRVGVVDEVFDGGMVQIAEYDGSKFIRDTVTVSSLSPFYPNAPQEINLAILTRAKSDVVAPPRSFDRVAIGMFLLNSYGMRGLVGIPELEQLLVKFSAAVFPLGSFIQTFGVTSLRGTVTRGFGVVSKSGVDTRTGEVSITAYSNAAGFQKINVDSLEPFNGTPSNSVEISRVRPDIFNNLIRVGLESDSMQLRALMGYVYGSLGPEPASAFEKRKDLADSIFAGYKGYSADLREREVGSIVGRRINGRVSPAVVSGIQPLEISVMVDEKIEVIGDALTYELVDFIWNAKPAVIDEAELDKSICLVADVIFGRENSVERSADIEYHGIPTRGSSRYWKIRAIGAAIMNKYGIAGIQHVLREFPMCSEMFDGLNGFLGEKAEGDFIYTQKRK